jgi:WYL_2, Sm-like SH3 beta-barrel fold
MNDKQKWTDAEWTEFREWVKSCLKSDVCLVEFTKKDGTKRSMRCTLKPDLLPQVELTEDKKERTITATDNVPVFDTEANGWRSFNIRSVDTFTFGVL